MEISKENQIILRITNMSAEAQEQAREIIDRYMYATSLEKVWKAQHDWNVLMALWFDKDYEAAEQALPYIAKEIREKQRRKQKMYKPDKKTKVSLRIDNVTELEIGIGRDELEARLMGWAYLKGRQNGFTVPSFVRYWFELGKQICDYGSWSSYLVFENVEEE